MSRLTLAQANKIIEAALALARQRGYRAMGIVVLDEAGHLRAAQREDGASMFRIDIATGKAWAAAGMGASSRALNERARDNPLFYGSLESVDRISGSQLRQARRPRHLALEPGGEREQPRILTQRRRQLNPDGQA
jgi:uncharacterized protein GlcG (DUF336 family)